MSLDTRRQSWEPRTPRYVEARCVDCPRTFKKNALATKQVRCPDCALVRKKAVVRANNQKWWAVYRVTPCPSLVGHWKKPLDSRKQAGMVDAGRQSTPTQEVEK